MAFTVTEARAQFPTLVELAEKHEEVVIVREDGSRVQLVPVDDQHGSDCRCLVCGEATKTP